MVRHFEEIVDKSIVEVDIELCIDGDHCEEESLGKDWPRLTTSCVAG